MRAERENAEAVGESHGVDADADDEAENAAGSGGTQDARSRSEAMHGCELGPRCPLFYMALNRLVAALTGGGSVSGLLPTGRRRRPRCCAPPCPEALSPGPDRWRLRLQPDTSLLASPNGTDARGQSHHPSCMSVRH